VNGVGKQLLARAALPAQQYRCRRLGGTHRLLHRLLHQGALGHNLGEGILGGQAAYQLLLLLQLIGELLQF